MNPRPLLLAFALAVATTAGLCAAETRFSQTLAISERAELGFNRLSSDQVAVLDALVRRDLNAQGAPAHRGDPPPAARFSQRLTAEERATAGLTLLSEKELARLDALIDQHASAALARVLLAPPEFVTTGMRRLPSEAKTAPEVHGSISLSFGVGKGYSERSGGMTLNYEDPAHNLSVMFGYSESYIKGATPYYRDGYVGVPPFVP